MINASNKVSRNSAVAGVATALLYGVQFLEGLPDLPTWGVMVLGGLAVGLSTFVTGYQVRETNPAPSAVDTIRREGLTHPSRRG